MREETRPVMFRLIIRSSELFPVNTEFAEPAAKGETEPIVREKYLEQHIEGAEEHSAARGAIEAKGDLDAIKDNQLKSAIELLKSWEILRHLEKK